MTRPQLHVCIQQDPPKSVKTPSAVKMDFGPPRRLGEHGAWQSKGTAEVSAAACKILVHPCPFLSLAAHQVYERSVKKCARWYKRTSNNDIALRECYRQQSFGRIGCWECTNDLRVEEMSWMLNNLWHTTKIFQSSEDYTCHKI